jgi:CubicO group peptidase (beta-lactamase class C family)
VATEIHGFCDPRFRLLKEAFVANFADGLEVGASFAATWQGKPVVELWAGHADWARTRAWERDTTVLLCSTMKVPLILSFLMLVDRGQVDLDATVATYWPEFAAGGKAGVTVREAMSHRAGVPGFEPPVAWLSLYDWDATCAYIAGEQHWFGGESRVCYHPTTFGYLLGEIMRRVDGRLPSQFFREEIAEPAGIDLAFGMRSEAEAARTAEIDYMHPPGTFMSRNELARRVTESTGKIGLATWQTWPCRLAEIPAGIGYGNGRSIARLGSMAAMGGELDGRRYLSRAILDEATTEQVYGEDPYLGVIRLGLGFGLQSEGFPTPTATTFHWGGYGGSFCMMDKASTFSCGYAMNNFVEPDDTMLADPRAVHWIEALNEVMPSL